MARVSHALVEHRKGAMISTVFTCENGHITVNPQCLDFICIFASCNPDLFIGSLSSRCPCLSTHIDVEIIPPKPIICDTPL